MVVGPVLNGLRNFATQLGTRRLMLMGGVALVLLATLGTLALQDGTPEMGFLYTDLEPAAAQSITEKLKAQDIPFEITADGTSVMAPRDRLAELRMSLAGEQLGGKIGYEVLDEEEPFGVSASRARLNETRAIEGELVRSIESLENVTKARVHIVMPERAVFTAEARKATAAVTVKTVGRLSGESVQAIRHLVASAVPDLSPESVSVIDQAGTLLARAGEPGATSGADLDERQTAIETRLRSQIETMLEPIVGFGKVRAEVAVLIDRDQRREEAQVFDPDTQVIARQITVESGEQNDETAASADGATVAAQLPEGEAQGGTTGGDSRRSASNENSEDTTYENSKTHTVTVHAPGKINRLTVAVMVDGGEGGLPPAQVQRLTRLVENAVGFDSERGDSVVVEAMPFAAAELLDDKEESWLSPTAVEHLMNVLKLLIIIAAGLVAVRMLRPKAAPEPAAEATMLTAQNPEMLALAEQAADGDPEAIKRLEALHNQDDSVLLDQEIALAQVDGRIKLSALKRIGDAITASPAESASVIRQWMNS